MRAAKHLYRVRLVLLLLVVSWGGADIPEGRAVNPEGGAVNPEGGAGDNPEGGAVNPLGGAVQKDQELNKVSFDCFSFYFPNQRFSLFARFQLAFSAVSMHTSTYYCNNVHNFMKIIIFFTKLVYLEHGY
jgi:hypothetical protein